MISGFSGLFARRDSGMRDPIVCDLADFADGMSALDAEQTRHALEVMAALPDSQERVEGIEVEENHVLSVGEVAAAVTGLGPEASAPAAHATTLVEWAQRSPPTAAPRNIASVALHPLIVGILSTMRDELGREDSVAPFTGGADTFDFRGLHLCSTIHPSVLTPFSAAHFALNGVRLYYISWKRQRGDQLPRGEGLLSGNVPCGNPGCAGVTNITSYGVTNGSVNDGGVVPILTPSGKFDYVTGPKRRCATCGTYSWDFEGAVLKRLPKDLQLEVPYRHETATKGATVYFSREMSDLLQFSGTSGTSSHAWEKIITRCVAKAYVERMLAYYTMVERNVMSHGAIDCHPIAIDHYPTMAQLGVAIRTGVSRCYGQPGVRRKSLCPQKASSSSDDNAFATFSERVHPTSSTVASPSRRISRKCDGESCRARDSTSTPQQVFFVFRSDGDATTASTRLLHKKRVQARMITLLLLFQNVFIRRQAP
jgi:hypothetical protein